MSVNVLAPTVSVLEGPVTEALQPAIAYAGGSLEPFLLRELIVYPSLPDATPEENDLSVTVIWGGAGQPGVGAVTMTGIAPILTFNAGEALATPTLGSVTVAGLAPDLGIPLENERTKEPRTAPLDCVLLDPSLLTEMKVGTLVDSPATIAGLVPTLATRAGWTTVELSGTAVWTDVGSP